MMIEGIDALLQLATPEQISDSDKEETQQRQRSERIRAPPVLFQSGQEDKPKQLK
jgi:hypothetical protein